MDVNETIESIAKDFKKFTIEFEHRDISESIEKLREWFQQTKAKSKVHEHVIGLMREDLKERVKGLHAPELEERRRKYIDEVNLEIKMYMSALTPEQEPHRENMKTARLMEIARRGPMYFTAVMEIQNGTDQEDILGKIESIFDDLVPQTEKPKPKNKLPPSATNRIAGLN